MFEFQWLFGYLPSVFKNKIIIGMTKQIPPIPDIHPSLQYVKGIGPKRAEALANLGIKTIRDLFLYYPHGYLDRSQIVRIADLQNSVEKNKPVTIFGEVFRQEARRTRRGNRLIFILTVRDESGFLSNIWFEGFQWLKNAFENGEYLALSAVPTLDKLNRPQFIHPQYDRLKSAEEDEPDWGKLFNTGSIIPKYHSNAELEKVGLDSRGFRRIIRHALDRYLSTQNETLSSEIMRHQNLCEGKTALRSIHFPGNFDELEQARRRLKFEELFYFQLMLAWRKRNAQEQERELKYTPNGTLVHQLIRSLHFELTNAQKRVLQEIMNDFKSRNLMNRLLQGDVGSGKTIIALCAALLVVENGTQVAFMAPTEILAEQHYRTLIEFLKGIPVNVRLLTGGQKKKLREDILEDIREGNALIVVGTHALIEEKVEFSKLGFIIVDEQHRFGVLQRASLRLKGLNPDVLIMTATPIPRSLAMTLYGDLEVSIIDEMPSNRKPIRTVLRSEKQKERVYQFVKDEIRRGRQAYIVFPLIEESENRDLKAAAKEYEYLQKHVFSEFKLGLLHGRLKSDAKEDIMQKFKKGEIHVLVSTTIIEVGIDIPNATVMLIENAERFGLAQLHQLRGRVGRGTDQSYCILIADYDGYNKNAKLNESESKDERELARTRLETMVETLDGFKIAEADLRLRGPGEFFGTQQSGVPGFKLANLLDDAELVGQARTEAFNLIKNDPSLCQKENGCIKKTFEETYREFLEYGRIG
jgi:ATP-dependent DNA helicase RecG